MTNEILVTNWEHVRADEFYLTDEKWALNDVEGVNKARELQKDGNLYYAYIVDAKNYAIYTQMDAQEVFVNNDLDIITYCESTVIDNKHDKRIALDE